MASAGKELLDERVAPAEPIDKLIGPLERFLHVQAAGGVALLVCTLVALGLANSPLRESFGSIWKTPITFGFGSFQMSHSLKHWINDGLMAIFFFVIGLEVKRELVLGELRELRRAMLPVMAALGGMLVPAAIYFSLQRGEAGQDGWGIPMATDIAFVVGCMAVMSSRVPASLRVLLLSLAIADDIGAILVIAIGYTEDIHLGALGLGGAGLLAVFVLARLGVRSLLVYTIAGILVWLAFHESGVHATIAGVILGLMTPARSYLASSSLQDVLGRASGLLQGDGWESLSHRAEKVRKVQWATREAVSPLEYLESVLHPWVGFLIMPVFALANAGVAFEIGDFAHPIALAVAAGLVLGKPLGIVAFGFLAVRLGWARLPEGVTWGVLAGGGFLAGIGFTMALFIAGLALRGEALEAAKVGILGASALAAGIGTTLLLRLLPRRPGQPGSSRPRGS